MDDPPGPFPVQLITEGVEPDGVCATDEKHVVLQPCQLSILEAIIGCITQEIFREQVLIDVLVHMKLEDL